MTRQLIDISSWQHPTGESIDFRKVAQAGIWGVIVKATQGAAYVNPWFAEDIDSAQAAGLATGAYHFAEPGGASAPDQAGHHLRTIGQLDLPLGLWLDLEITQGRVLHEVVAWRNEFFGVTSQTGRPGGLYVPVDLADKMVDLHEMPFLWLANPSGLDHQYVPAIIQTGQENIDGIHGAVDIDLLVSDRWVNIPPYPGVPAPAPAPAPAPTSQGGTAILREGDKGPVVMEVQRRLLSWGARIAVDGDFGPRTNNAVRSLQRHTLITVDGIVGPGTWVQLLQFHPVEAAWPPPDQMPQIERGSRGRTVVAAQVDIDATGMLIDCDGVFGPETERAVRALQTGRHLQVDGIIGPRTWAALL